MIHSKNDNGRQGNHPSQKKEEVSMTAWWSLYFTRRFNEPPVHQSVPADMQGSDTLHRFHTPYYPAAKICHFARLASSDPFLCVT